MIILGILAGIVLILFLVYSFLYYPRKADSFEINDPESGKRILIATQDTDFKNAYVELLCESMEGEAVYVRGIDVGELDHVLAEEWDNILIINSFVIRLNKHVHKMIANSTDPEKFLVFVTSGGADWQPEEDFKVDAITSASHQIYIDDLVDLTNSWLFCDDLQNWKPDNHLLALIYCPQVHVQEACKAIDVEQEQYKEAYPDLVNMINVAGYYFMRLKDVPAAVEIFKLNVSLFPDHWNVYDSYGEALLVSGENEAAIRNYRKALELNPESKSASRAVKRLRDQK